jgi:hypothetical protein
MRQLEAIAPEKEISMHARMISTEIIPTCRSIVGIVLLLASLLIVTTASAQQAGAVFDEGFDEFTATNYALAEKLFEQGLKLQPDNAIGHYYMAETMSKLGREKSKFYSTTKRHRSLVLAPRRELGPPQKQPC